MALTELGIVPQSMKLSFGAAADVGMLSRQLADRLGDSVGLRNVLIHACVELDLEIPAASVPAARDQYGDYVRQVARWLRERPPG